ncbi:MAG TPA: radical SAM protein, partial [Chitinophagaceae bacterium]|nr:radical SAM protein [Chitinophagaceae bacterium]
MKPYTRGHKKTPLLCAMRILLTTLNAKYIHTNLAIRILYQLNKQHPGLEWKEFVIREPAESIAAQCMDYDVVAFSCYIWNITQTLAVTRVLKELNPEIKILLGGPEVSYEWEELMALEEIDFIICGEGETAFADFLQHYPEVDAVGALVQKKNGVVQYNPLRRAFDLKELEEIMPYAGDDTETLKDRVLYIETSRGCPYHCEFCLASLDNKVRYLPDRQIRNNLLYLMQHGRVIKFLDRTFNIKKDFTLSLFDFILLHYWNENVFQFEITADIVHPAIVQFVQERVPNGLFRFEIGIQTVNQEANLAVSRKQDFGKTSSVIRQLQHKIEMHLDLIVGLPFDYLPDIKYSIDSVFSLYPPELQLGFLKFLKGTPMREKELTHGYVYD